MGRRVVYFIVFWGLLAVALPMRAEVKPHGLISENMVLQQGSKANIWGTADAGERVVVSFRDREITTTANADGRWLAPVRAGEAGGPFTLTITGQNRIELKNVLVGEVWVCSGQSNMWWPVSARSDPKELAGTENPSIRLFNVPGKLADEPASEVEAAWEECGPKTLGPFSAVAYHFGRELPKARGVPIGLIHASYGGSGVGQWISQRALAEDPGLASWRESQSQGEADRAKQQERLRAEMERYEAAATKARKEGKTPPPPPQSRGMTTHKLSRLYNAMIAPLQRYPIRGAIWYQGEANVSQAALYRQMFPAMIRGWRQEWGQGDFPFLFVQIAPHLKIVETPQDSQWAELREAQLYTSLSVPRTGMAVITEWGHEADIHPLPKRPIGERLALVARGVAYGEPIEYSGPLVKGLQIVGHEAVLTFDHVGNGLVARRLVLEDVKQMRDGTTGGALHVATDASTANVPLQGFAIAGEDGRFVPARAEIRGQTVVASSPEVARPTVVRYGWADYPTGNLFNRDGLPATPFRTDGPPLAMDQK
jgi:sialate O-acetylesterase